MPPCSVPRGLPKSGRVSSVNTTRPGSRTSSDMSSSDAMPIASWSSSALSCSSPVATIASSMTLVIASVLYDERHSQGGESLMTSDARERMVRSAAYLFRERGFSGTAFSDVIAHSGAPRGSIYHHFPGGKDQLAEEAVRYAGDYLSAGVRAATRDDDPVAAVRAFIGWWRRVLVKSDFRAGCPIAAVTVESRHADAASTAFRNWQNALAAGLVSAGATAARA